MQSIALINQKGGVGKTTIALHLTTGFVSAGYQTVLLDLDPQASAAEWKDARDGEEPVVMAIPASRLLKVADEVGRAGAEIVIMDTAPHSEGTALDAARLADLIIVPCQPSIMDLRAMRKTADLLKHLKKPTFALMNGVAPQGAVAEEAAGAITAQYGIPICPVRFGVRVAFNRCLISGQTAPEFEPGGKAAQEAIELFEWACKLVGLPASKIAA